MFKVLIALSSLMALALPAQADHNRMLERLECRGEVTRSGDLKLGITSWLREHDGDLDRDYDVVRCRHAGVTRSGTHMFDCNHPYVTMARISDGNRGLAQFKVVYGNTHRSIRSGIHSCMIENFHQHDRSCDHGDSYPERGLPDQGDVEQGPEQGPEQGGKIPMK